MFSGVFKLWCLLWGLAMLVALPAFDFSALLIMGSAVTIGTALSLLPRQISLLAFLASIVDFLERDVTLVMTEDRTPTMVHASLAVMINMGLCATFGPTAKEAMLNLMIWVIALVTVSVYLKFVRTEDPLGLLLDLFLKKDK